MIRGPCALLCLVAAIGCAGPAVTTDETDTDDVRDVTVRVLTWNVYELGPPGSAQYEATRSVLARIDADLVSLNELTSADRGALDVLAGELGYDTAFMPDDNPFGDWRNAVLTRLPVRTIATPSAAALARDSRANDLTRLAVVTTVELPAIDGALTVVGQHLKSGFEARDMFRRAVDAQRTAQAADVPGPVLVVGDLNADAEEMPEQPPTFASPPAGLPQTYRLGSDLADDLSAGLDNDAFAPFLAAGLTPAQAAQLDGRLATRPASDRRIDWILASADLRDDLAAEVYDSLDEGRDGLPKPGPVPARTATAEASDHLPVFADVVVREPGSER